MFKKKATKSNRQKKLTNQLKNQLLKDGNKKKLIRAKPLDNCNYSQMKFKVNMKNSQISIVRSINQMKKGKRVIPLT